MDSILNRKSIYILIAVLFLQLTVLASVFFDLPVVRQVVGFIYFTIIPGFIFLKLLRFNNFSGLETTIFSLGFGIAFLMFTGLAVNELGGLVGISRPLSTIPLMATLSIPILICGVLVYLRNRGSNTTENNQTVLSLMRLSPLALLFICLPILSVIGAFWVNSYNSNLVIALLIITIAVLFSVGIFSKRFLAPRFYPLAALTIAISLLFHYSLISNYIVSLGSDVNIEYFISNIALSNGHWSSKPTIDWLTSYGRVNSMLSITILPPMYSSLLNIDLAWVFKILSPLIFAFVPLGLYQICQMYVSKKYALISAFLFMAESTFYSEMLGLNRQMIGELFFVLLLYIILNKKMKQAQRTISFTIFSFALVTSHYALAEILLILLVVIFVSLLFLKRSNRNVTASMIVLLFVMMFTWYIYTSQAHVFTSFISFADHVISQLGDFFNPASRGSTFQTWINPLATAPSVWNVISRIFVYITQGLILLGFLVVLLKRKKFDFDTSFLILGSAAMTLLIALVLVPGLADTLNLTRFYHILLFFLAIFSVLGGEVVVKAFFKRKRELAVCSLLLIVLVPYFLFQTGFVYELAKSESWSLPLSMNRMSKYRLQRLLGVVNHQDVASANWMSRNVRPYPPLYADVSSQANILISHGMFYSEFIYPLSNTTKVTETGTVYLSSLNVVHGIVVGAYKVWNSSEISSVFDGLSKIYSNGASEIYKNSFPETSNQAP